MLRVRGNSMIDEQIRDGDFVVVNERQRADNGEMVIALVNGTSATVKKYYRERDGRIRLQPANETMQPMYVHENDISIQGIVVGVHAHATERPRATSRAGAGTLARGILERDAAAGARSRSHRGARVRRRRRSVGRLPAT